MVVGVPAPLEWAPIGRQRKPLRSLDGRGGADAQLAALAAAAALTVADELRRGRTGRAAGRSDQHGGHGGGDAERSDEERIG